MNNILRKSIVDANALKNVAEKRALSLLSEEFAPKVRTVLSELIKEEISTGQDQPGGYNEDADQDAITSGDNINNGTGDGPPIRTGSGAGENHEAKDVHEDEDLGIEDNNDEKNTIADDEDEGLDVGKDEEEPVSDGDEVVEIEDDEFGDEQNTNDDYENMEDEEENLETGHEEPDGDEVIEIIDDEDEEDEAKLRETNQEIEDEKDEKVKDEAKKLRKENKILRETLNVLKHKFDKLNLFNAKLAYAVKLMNTPGLSVNEKKQIAESFDQAKTIREAQMIYSITKKQISKVSQPVKKVLANRNVRSVISESTQQESGYKRLSELAGI